MTTERVYENYTQAELDRQYDQRSLVPDINHHMQRWAEASALARKSLASETNVIYGADDNQLLDIFGVGGSGKPVVVFFHGGAWRSVITKDQSAYPANAFVPQGVLFVAVGFGAAPAFTLDDMVSQCRDAVAFLHRNAVRFGGDPDRIHAFGHSSGAHLAAMLATTDWQAAYGLPADVIKGLAAVSGVYDLHPVRLSARNDYLHLDEGTAARNSPIKYLAALQASAVIAWGEGELDEFKRQNREFADAVSGHAKLAYSAEMPGRHHFDMADEICRQDGALFKASLSLLGLSSQP